MTRRSPRGAAPPLRGRAPGPAIAVLAVAWSPRVLSLALLALLWAPRAEACPYCSVGARGAWPFILVVVGGFIAGAALLLAWSLESGQFEDPDGVSRRVLELDRLTGVRR